MVVGKVVCTSLALASLAAGQDVYKLKFLSDYQEGAWDTDAAENVAYDANTHRAFVASAESIDVNVIDFSDPTMPTKTGTVSVSADLEFACPEVDCIYEVMDFGGGGAPCGFAEVIKIVHDREDFSCCGWHDGPFELDPTMTSAEACQALCAAEVGCQYFSFENECQVDADGVCTDIRHNECYLKAEYTAADAAENGFPGAADCFSYVAWEEGPSYDLHTYDEFWFGASGPEVCGMVRSESVQSVAVLNVDSYQNAILAAAVPHVFEWANGYLAFYDALTLAYLGCGEAGNKPEGITSYGNMVSCINEGSAREDGLVDHDGSMTLCEVVGSANFDCTNYHFVEENFAEGAWTLAAEFRSRGLRLYGPNADDIGLDLEPEHGAFVLDGAGLVVSFQDNNGYAFFDTDAKKYTYMGGYGYIPATLDASDRDGFVNIKSDWAGTALWGTPMPDQIATIVVGGVTYILTANEGDTRDGEDIIGAAEATDGTEVEGEETRYGDLGDPSVATCSGCAADEELGRVLTTTYMPSDFATNACGLNSCSAEELVAGLSDGFECIYHGADYGGFLGDLCDFADNPTDAYTVNDATWEAPGWYSGTVTVDTTMTSPQACQALCAAHAECDFFSYEFELGVHECLFKIALADCPYDNYVRWWQHWEDAAWEGYSGPGECAFSKAPYTSDPDTTDISGSPGGSYSIGTRSFTVWRMDALDAPLVRVFDSGSMFEEATLKVAGGLCDGCDVAGAPEACADRCPFNSDEAPPAMDDRSDAKGPEPECVTTGVMSDGTVLAFIGLERTGGIVVYDVSDPTAPVYQDFLNVRNWLVDDDVPETGTDEFLVDHALNDGPESLVFVDAAHSPIGQEMLIAVAPLAGRTTAYILEMGAPRADDGSCPNIASCPYLPTSVGGTGAALGLTAADVCATEETCAALGVVGGGSDGGDKKKKSSNNQGLVIAIIIVAILVAVALAAVVFFAARSKTYQTLYQNAMTENAMHNNETEMTGKKESA